MAQSPKTSQGGASLSSKVRPPSMETVYTVSTSSLTTEVEAVTHALRWVASRGDNQTTHAIILTDSMSLLQTDWDVSMVDIHLRKLLWVYCPGQARRKRNDRADTPAGKATLL